ncbi:hypothetical protein CDG79_14880 [Nostoc sp. 'Peltigera membranacea cyanobiont' 232]|nr:hypothetical protein CDG79_14880 [Nostoc sp. 'Peltigera membranacea cyanobiont' 232]
MFYCGVDILPALELQGTQDEQNHAANIHFSPCCCYFFRSSIRANISLDTEIYQNLILSGVESPLPISNRCINRAIPAVQILYSRLL